MPKPTKRSFTFEFKLDLVRRVLDGHASAAELAHEHDLSSPKLVENWVRAHRRQGEDALRPKPKGRPPGEGRPGPGRPSFRRSYRGTTSSSCPRRRCPWTARR